MLAARNEYKLAVPDGPGFTVHFDGPLPGNSSWLSGIGIQLVGTTRLHAGAGSGDWKQSEILFFQ